MKTVAFVPVKLENERLPGKNLKEFDDGTPLVSIILSKLSQLKGNAVDEVFVYCSNPSIRDYLPDNVSFLQRPAYLDGSSVKGADIYRSFVGEVHADVYVLCHATSPFVTTEHIVECIEAVKSASHDSAFCAKRIQNFLWTDGAPLNFDFKNPPRTQDMAPIYQEQSTPYVFSKKTFELYGARTGVNPYICECTEIECIDIDYPEDFQLANVVYMSLLKEYQRSEFLSTALDSTDCTPGLQ